MAKIVATPIRASARSPCRLRDSAFIVLNLFCARAACFSSASHVGGGRGALLPLVSSSRGAAASPSPTSPSSSAPLSPSSGSDSTLRAARDLVGMGFNATGLPPLSQEQKDRIARYALNIARAGAPRPTHAYHTHRRNKAEALQRKAEREGGGGSAVARSAGSVAGKLSRESSPGEQGALVADSSFRGSGANAAAVGALECTLQTYFGYSNFRHGQREVCEAVLNGQDVSVFWATGSGKSLCYQIPALHTQKTVVVVSPLISLMNDQVTALNYKIDLGDNTSSFMGRLLPPATMLGTAGNPADEEPALQGLFRLVYVTPEKIMAGNFLERLGGLSREGKISLIAIDEAHCVSQWGPDFRPSFFDLKEIRNALPNVPLMALTATAVPRVKNDILTILQLRNPFVSTSSFDRANLRISVHRKTSMSSDLLKLVETLSKSTSGSTIVYVPTTKETETVAGFLSSKLTGVNIGFYHGSVPLDQRDRVHTGFLSGECHVVVATQAFGMGIDKPDIRRVVHYGSPKTFEEYYQQIGRAGRDGAPAVCDMYCSENDFKKYDSDFYTAKLSETAKAAVKESTDALRNFANNHERCRRLSILSFFHETPSWGERCGTCDTCLRHTSGDQTLKRDFSAEAHVLLAAVKACGARPQSTTKLLNLIGAPSADITGISVTPDERKHLMNLRKALARGMKSDDRLKEILVLLHSEGFLQRKTVTASFGGMSRTWEVHEMTAKAQIWLDTSQTQREPIMMPVPQIMIDEEKAVKKRVEENIAELVNAGVSLDQVPAEEIEDGSGDVMTVLMMWVRTIQRLRTGETSSQASKQRADELEATLQEVQHWRDNKAKELKMAPVAVLPDYLAMKIIHARATDKDAIIAAGVRIRGVEELAALMLKRFPPPAAAAAGSGGLGAGNQGNLLLPEGEWAATKAWAHAVYKVAKNGALPKWEVSYKRFTAGEHPQAIAMDQENGKPIQANTVIGHILEAMTHGRPVNLRRLVTIAGAALPNDREWTSIEDAVAGLGLDVVKLATVSTKDIMLASSGRADIPGDQKTDDDKKIEAAWYERVKWFLAFKRAGVPVSFTSTTTDTEIPASKRQRT